MIDVKNNTCITDSTPDFRQAAAQEIEAVVALYRASLGTSGCTWDDDYPSRETAESDLASGGLYVLRLGGRIIGAVSILSENELDSLDCFVVREGAGEFSRITVLPEYRGRGYARFMLGEIIEKFKRSGISALHIMVAVGNQPALALYRSFGFTLLDEYSMYGRQYYAAEKLL